MAYRLFVVLALMFTLPALAGCEKAAPEAPKAEAVAPAKPAEPAKPAAKKPEPAKPAVKKPEPKKADELAEGGYSEEIVFDPRKPPAGFKNCHRNHCHRIGGGVASYAQVMQEIGATKMVNVPKRAPMPPAPADVAAPPADAEKTPSGLASKMKTAGDGKTKPNATSVVTVHYTGWTTNGKPFDSSVSRGKPATFPLNRVIPGWTEGLQLMSVGEERRLWIPEELAYKGRPGKPAGMLVFDVELLSIREAGR